MKTRKKAPIHDFWITPNIYLAFFTLWLGFIVLMNTLPADSLPGKGFFSRFPHFDKFVHFTEYLFLTFFLWNLITTSMEKLGSKQFPTILLAFPFVFAILDELMQLPIPGRQTDFLDIIFDWLGAATIIMLGYGKSWMTK